MNDNLSKLGTVAPADGGNPPTGTVIEIPGGLELDRTYVQSRTPITLAISTELASFGDTFSLYNDSTGQSLVKQQLVALADPEETSGKPMLWLDADAKGYELWLKLYQLDPALQGKFTFGQNNLRLVAKEDTANAKRSLLTLRRADFSLFGVARSTFADAIQLQNGFEAELGQWHQPVVTTAEKSTLTLGVIPMLSR